MNITVTKVEDTSIVGIEGRLDTTNYTELETSLSDLTAKNEKRIVLDLTKMDYISSSGLRILLMYLKKMKAVGGRFMLSGMSPEIKEIFEISGFINIFEIFDDPDSAVKS